MLQVGLGLQQLHLAVGKLLVGPPAETIIIINKLNISNIYLTHFFMFEHLVKIPEPGMKCKQLVVVAHSYFHKKHYMWCHNQPI